MSISKSVGIITYHRAINYGAVLQAYALNKFINSLGIPCETIDYHCDAVDIQYRYRERKRCTSWKNFVAHNITCLLHAKKKKRMIKFRESFKLSAPCNKAELPNISADYDILITGSDQVFNPTCHRDDSAFFLDFSNAQLKVAYAVSLGSIASFEKSQLPLDVLLRDFSGLSFREKDAADYMTKRLSRECYAVVDPVWLLTAQEWKSIARSNEKQPYIFVYNLMDYSYMRAFVKRLKKKTGLQVIVVNRTIMGDVAYSGWCRNASNCSPNDFLGYILNAEYVVTDSFHGTSFAICFEKKFFAAANPKKDNTNSRLVSVLRTAGLEDRLITSGDENREIPSIIPQSVGTDMQEAIERSKEFLSNIVIQEVD